MRSAIIFGHFALCALFIIVSDAKEGKYSLPDDSIDLTEQENHFLMGLVRKMADKKDPKSWRVAEDQFKIKYDARADRFKARTAYELAWYARKYNTAKVPRKILDDLKAGADKKDGEGPSIALSRGRDRCDSPSKLNNGKDAQTWPPTDVPRKIMGYVYEKEAYEEELDKAGKAIMKHVKSFGSSMLKTITPGKKKNQPQDKPKD